MDIRLDDSEHENLSHQWIIGIKTNLGKLDHDLTVLPNPGIMVNKGNHPKMAARFRLVKY